MMVGLCTVRSSGSDLRSEGGHITQYSEPGYVCLQVKVFNQNSLLEIYVAYDELLIAVTVKSDLDSI